MQRYIHELTEVETGLIQARLDLHEQQGLVQQADCDESHHALVQLLSNGLRMYLWLADRKRALEERIGEAKLGQFG